MNAPTIYTDLEQGSDAWLQARCGVVTASVIGQLITSSKPGADAYDCPKCGAVAGLPCTSIALKTTKQLKTTHPERIALAKDADAEPILTVAATDTARKTILRLAAERISGHVESQLETWDMMRGHEDEPKCRAEYEQRHNVTVDGGLTWAAPSAQTGILAGYGPTGLAWDAAAERWMMLALTRAGGNLRTSLWTLPSAGGAWSRLADVPEAGWTWFFPSGFAIDGALWIVAGYGALPGSSTWVPITLTSRDAGATWSTPAAPSGLPASGEKGWSEPQIAKKPDGTWVMAIRNDVDYRVHLASSADGVTWTYGAPIASEVSGSPEIAVTRDGIIVVLLRKRPAKIEWHGEWAWTVSYDGGTTWAQRDDFPSDGRSMLYGALAPVDAHLVCVFASEDDVTKPWQSASILTTIIEPREVRPPLEDTPPLPPLSRASAPAKPWQPPAWRYFATRLHGDGTESLLHPDLPLTIEPVFTLSGTSDVRATIPVEVPNLTDAGRDVLVAWSTVIWVELDGRPRGAWILSDVEEQGPTLSLSMLGFTGYAKGYPYGGEKSFVNVDALDVFRHVWEHIQAQPGANLGLTVDAGASGVLLGRQAVDAWPKLTEGTKAALATPGSGFQFIWTKTPAKKAVTTKRKVKGKIETKTTPAKPAVTETLYATATRTYPSKIADGATVIVRNKTTGIISRDLAAKGLPAGTEVMGVATKTKPKEDTEGEQLEPFTLSWFADSDLGAKLDTIADQGDFDFWEAHSWDGEKPVHALHVAKSAGRVRDDLRFVVGENIIEAPTLSQKGEDVVTEVAVLGAGEGRAMIRGTWKATAPGRLRRVKTITDKSIRAKADADARAAREGKLATAGPDIATLVVRDHPNAPLGSWGLGDTITAMGDGTGWGGDWTMQLRVLSYTLSPEKDTATLTVARGEATT